MAVVLDGMDLTDVQWAVLEPTFRPRRRPDGRGRPWTDPRAVTRWERHVGNYLGMVQLACARILLRAVMR
jgi:hypothetical protein